MIFVLFGVGFLLSKMVSGLDSFVGNGRIFLLGKDCVVFNGVNIPQFLYPFLFWQISGKEIWFLIGSTEENISNVGVPELRVLSELTLKFHSSILVFLNCGGWGAGRVPVGNVEMPWRWRVIDSIWVICSLNSTGLHECGDSK